VALFEQLIVPSDDMMKGVHRAVVDGSTGMLTLESSGWRGQGSGLSQAKKKSSADDKEIDIVPSTGWPFWSFVALQKDRAALNQTSLLAVPVKGFTLALNGALHHTGMLRAIGECEHMAIFETDAVICLEQHLWQTYAEAESWLRLIEFVLYLAVLLSYCWLLQDEMDCSLIEVDCQGSANVAGVCLVWVSKELPLFGQLPLWIICAGVVIIV
jgi:hypothetical protein